MIAYCASIPPLDDALIGCRMQTLAACYGALPNALDWYKSDTGGVLCRFGGVLLLAGDINFGELFAFADMLGVSRVEWTADSAALCAPPAGWASRRYPVLCGIGGAAPITETIKTNFELRRCFEILCQSDAQFAREADYLPWLSDMTRRRNTGRAETFMHADAAVACVTARGRHSTYLSSVAVLPEKRGFGLGLALVRSVLAHPALQGLTIYTAAQSGPLAVFYRQAGFEALPQLLTITEKRNPA